MRQMLSTVIHKHVSPPPNFPISITWIIYVHFFFKERKRKNLKGNSFYSFFFLEKKLSPSTVNDSLKGGDLVREETGVTDRHSVDIAHL